jgi:hypothetical protein
VKPISPLWYTAAFFFALGSIMLGAAVASGSWGPVRDATLHSPAHRIDAANRSVAVFTDTPQPDRKITCRAIGPGKEVTTIQKAALAITVESEGDQWHLLALLPEGRDGIRVTCTPDDRRNDDANYDYAIINGFESRSNAGKGISILGVVGGVAAMAYIYYLNRRRRIYAALDATTTEAD